MLNKAVELILGVFVLILLSADSDSDLSGDVSDSSAPHEPVQAGINSNILNKNERWICVPL